MEENKENKTQDGNNDIETGHETGQSMVYESTDSGDDCVFVGKEKVSRGVEKSNPFARKSRISRTPPQRERASSSTVMRDVSLTAPTHGQEEVCHEKEKRKRQEDSPTAESTQGNTKLMASKKPREDPVKGKQAGRTEEVEREIKTIERLEKLINHTVEEIKFLRRVVNENRNTKVEVKNTSAVLSEIARQLELEGHAENLRAMAERLRRQEENEGAAQTEVRGNYPRETAETATQTEKSAWREPRPQKNQEDYAKVVKAHTDEEILEAANLDWEKKWFDSTTIVEGNPLNSTAGGNLAVFLQEGEREMENGIARQFRDRFPDLMKVTQEEPGIGYIKVINTIQVGNEAPTTHHRMIYKVVLRENTGRELIGAFKSLRSRIEVHQGKEIAFPIPTGVDECVLRKILELVFRDAGVKINIHVPQKRGGRGKPQSSHPTITGKQRQKKEQKATDVLLIRQGQTTYGEMLKGLKKMVAENENVIAPKEVRRARDGRLLLTFDKGATGVEDLKQQIKTSWRGAEVAGGNLDSRKRTLHIKGMDALVEEGDIRDSICAVLAPSQWQALEIGQSRPMFGGNKAVTVKVPSQGADELLKKGKIKIGFNACKIEERLEVIKCFRCWCFGHMARDCSGPDRKLLCISCGQEGHTAAVCKNTQHCLLCKEAGHRSGAGNCPKFKEALATARRAEKEG